MDTYKNVGTIHYNKGFFQQQDRFQSINIPFNDLL